MLKLIEGGFHAGGREFLNEAIEERVLAGKRVFLFVPEQETVLAEREMARRLPPSAPLTFEVTNFSRFANTVFRKFGGLSGKTADKGKRALLMWQALTELAPTLTRRTNGSVTPGEVDLYLCAVRELSSLAVTPEDLLSAKAAVEDKDGRLADKLENLSKAMKLYKDLLAKNYVDEDDDLSRLCGKLEAEPRYLENTVFFFEGFTSFTETQYGVLTVLMKHAEVSVLLTIPKAAHGDFEYTEVRNCEARLLRAADLAGCKKALPAHLEDLRLSAEGVPALSGILDGLWRTSPIFDKNCLQGKSAVRMIEAATPYEACDFIAADIKRIVFEGTKGKATDVRYSDFAIVMRRAEPYAGVLDEALAKAGVPLFFSKRRDVSEFELIKLIYSAFAAVCGGFSRRDVLTYAKCALSGVARDEVDEFELYVEKWQITGKRFSDVWNMNPDGYTDRRAAGTDEKLRRINAVRERIVSPLSALAAKIKGTSDVRFFAEALVKDFLQPLGAEDALKRRAEEMRALGEVDLADDLSLLFPAVCDVLDSLCEVLGTSKCDAKVFLDLLKILFRESDVGHIPSYVDRVVAGAADQLRLYGKKHVYLLGVNAGEFPATGGEDSFFSERDKGLLELAGVAIHPERSVRAARELFIFSRAFSYATEDVTILSTLADFSYTKTKRADAVDRIEAMTKGAVKLQNLDTLPLGDRIYAPEFVLEHPVSDEGIAAEVTEAMTRAGYADALSRAEKKIETLDAKLDEETVDLLYRDGISLSQTRIDQYVSCPMRYFCKYDLKLDEGEIAEFDARNIGSFVHAIFERFFKELKARGNDVDAIPDDERRAIVEDAAKGYLDTVADGEGSRSERTVFLNDRLTRAAKPIVDDLCREFEEGAYKPAFFELNISDSSPDTPTPVRYKSTDGRQIRIGGQIDRVDTFKAGGDVYVRVVDYKTGQKNFSPEDLEKGENLQMFLYLKAVVETAKPAFRALVGASKDGRLIPAGVTYVKADLSDAKVMKNDDGEAIAEFNKNQKRQGMMLDSAANREATNLDYAPVRFKKDGEPDARTAHLLYPENGGWEALDKTIENAVRKVADEMLSGDVSARPYFSKKHKNTCDTCPYKAVCRNVRPSK